MRYKDEANPERGTTAINIATDSGSFGEKKMRTKKKRNRWVFFRAVGGEKKTPREKAK